MDFKNVKNVAVVGLSDKPDRASFRVAKYLQDCGYKIIPVNPVLDSVLGEKAYPDIASIPADVKVDVVDIFRRPEDVTPIVKQVSDRKDVKVVWMQEGIANDEAADIAEKAGMECIMDKCMLKEHMKIKS